ncbi:hypothetical protein [Janthinobacterium aquaticum]|uniref:hypothetical protein n=1 Tax=Janthinobacterium sp. FT58W TaxID=2654254 RepID=UPI0012644A5A|nr:hypothetical protein [Janthinobacterium sp. FT58W]KAB8042549.1 hypothetical protein GCM43_13575 [Janthinobacterium sp. FT58W]
MFHGIEVRLMADIEKYKQGMAEAKKIGGESMGFIASIFDKLKSLAGGMWDSLKSVFSGIGEKSKGAFSSLSDSASSAFGKVIGVLPGFNSAMSKTKDKMGETEEKSDSLIKKIGIGLVVAVTAAAAAIAVLVKKGLDADSALAGLAISSGITASQISRFEATAARSNVSATEFGSSMVKLRDKMKEAAASDGSTFFSKLGVDIVDANNALLKTDDVTIAVAKKIAAMSSEAEKYAAASKAGFEGKVQVLEDIARASDLSATTTDEQAAAVVRLGKIWHDILPGGKSMWAQISTFLTSSLTPAVTEASLTILKSKNTIVSAFNDIYGSGSSLPRFGEQIKEWGQSASQWFDKVAEAATKTTVSILKYVAIKTGFGDPSALGKGAAPAPVPGAVPLTGSGNPSITKDSEKEYDALTKAIEQKIAVQKMEIQTGAALTEGQRLLIKMNAELSDGTITMTGAQKAKRTEELNLLIAQEKLNRQAQEARAKGDAAASKEVAGLTTLIAAIKAKTAENEMELATGLAATENQKFAIKLNLEEERSKKNLSGADLARLNALKAEAVAQLAANKVAEEAVKAQQTERDVAKFINESTLARQESAAALTVESQMLGKSADARELAMVAVREQTALEKFLLQEKVAGKVVEEGQIKRLKAEADERTRVEQATLAQTKALGYAAQLAEENRRFAAESLFDEKSRAAALLKIDAAMWQERIALAGAGTDAQKRLQEEYSTWYSNQLAKPEIEANRKMWESIDSTAHDTFVSIFDSGKSAFDRLRDTLKNGLLDLLYQMTIKKWILNIGASVSGTGVAGLASAGGLGGTGAAGGLGGVGSLVQSAKTAYTIATQGFAGLTAGLGTSVVSLGTLFGSTAIEAFGAGLGSTGLVGAADAAGLYAASGGVGSAGAVTAGAYAGAAVTAAAGIAAGVLGGKLISGQFGSNATVIGGTGIGAVAGAFLGGPVGAAIGGALGGVIGGIGNRLFGMGDKKYGETGITGTLTGTGFTGNDYAKWSQKGGWFRSDKSGTDTSAVDATTSAAFVETYAAIRNVSATLANTLGVDTASLATRAQALNINLTGLKTEAERLDAVTTFFEGVGNTIAAELVPGLSQFQLKGEALSTTLQRVSQDYAGVDAALQLIGRTSQQAFGAVGVATIGARENLIKLAGSLDALTSGTSFFAENFLTEAEQMAPVLSSVADTLAALNMSGVKTVDQYKQIVLGLDLSSTSGQEMYIKLLALAPAFKAATDYTSQLAAATGDYAAVAKTASEIASEHRDLQQQLNELTKSETELLAIQRAGIADVNKALFDQVQAAKAVVTAKDAVAKAYETEAAAAKTLQGTWKAFGASLVGMNASLALGNQSILTPEQRYAEARAQFEKTLAAANAGDTTAQSGLSAAEQAFLSASQVVNASDAKYASDYARVMAANDEALKWASQQVDVQQASLDALTTLVSGLVTVNDSVLTVPQAIANLQAAMGVANGQGVQFTNAPVVAPVAPAPAVAMFDTARYSAASNAGSEALVAEVKALREELKGFRGDQVAQTKGLVRATVESNAGAAKTIVAGVEKSAQTSPWRKSVEYAE